jgi:hypothetical protein
MKIHMSRSMASTINTSRELFRWSAGTSQQPALSSSTQTVDGNTQTIDGCTLMRAGGTLTGHGQHRLGNTIASRTQQRRHLHDSAVTSHHDQHRLGSTISSTIDRVKDPI